MSHVGVVAKITAQEGKRSELSRALQRALDTANGEEGTIYYLLHEDVADASVLWTYELYASQDALQLHRGSEAYKALGPAIGSFLAARPELIFLNPVGGKGL